MNNAFATTNKGLENLLSLELIKLGATNTQITNAGVKFVASYDALMQINLHSALASRVLLEVTSEPYATESDIYDITYDVDWDKYFNVDNTIKVHTTAINCSLKSLNFITLKVKDAICDKFVNETSKRPDINKDNPSVRIYSFLDADNITLYVDTSGEGLFKRGYRQNKLEAPIKENLASSLVLLSGWDKNTPLLDPMCGSGTIIIEAISHAIGLAPGINRDFGFENLKCFDLNKWGKIKKDAINQINIDVDLSIFANDIDRNAVEITKDNIAFFKMRLSKIMPDCNLAIEKLIDKIQYSSCDFLHLNKPAPNGVIITNPPYGVRLDEQRTLAQFYPLLATHLKNQYTDWVCYILTSDLTMPKLMRLKPSKKTPLFNGALECRLFEIKIVAGSNR